MRYTIVTTFSDQGYEDYGRTMLESMEKYLDPSIHLVVYHDNAPIDNAVGRNVLPLETVCPDLVEFKNRNGNKEAKNFKFQAVRFAHKVYAMCHASTIIDTKRMIWLDADTELYDHVTPDYLDQFLDIDQFVSYLGRGGQPTETGFLAFDMTHPSKKEFFQRFKQLYDTDSLFELDEWHDAFVFDHLRTEMEAEGKFQSQDLSPGLHKSHFNQTFDGWMLHLKGTSKAKRDKHIGKALKRKQNRESRSISESS